MFISRCPISWTEISYKLTVAGKSAIAGIITSPAGTFSPYTATGNMLDIVVR